MKSKMTSWLKSHLVKDQRQPKLDNPDTNKPKLARLSHAVAKVTKFLHKDHVKKVEVNQPLMARNMHRSRAREGAEVDYPSGARDCVEAYHQVDESKMCARDLETLIFGHNVAHYGEAFNSSPANDGQGCTAVIGLEPTTFVNAVSLDDTVPPTNVNDSRITVDLPVTAARNPKTPIRLRDLSGSTAEVSSYSPVSQEPSSHGTSLDSVTQASAFDIFEPRDQPTGKVKYAGGPLKGLESPTSQERSRARFMSLTVGGSDRDSVCTVLTERDTGNAPRSGLRRRQSLKDLRNLFVAETDHGEDVKSSDHHVLAMPFITTQEEAETIDDGTSNSVLEEIKSTHASQIADLKEAQQDALNLLMSNNTGMKTAISGLRHTSAQMQQRLKDKTNGKEIAEQRCQELEEIVRFKNSQIEGMTSLLQARQVSFEELMTGYKSEFKISAEKEQALVAKEQVIAAKDVEIAARDRVIVSKSQEIEAKADPIASQNHKPATTEQTNISKDEKIFELQIEIDELSQQLSQMKVWSDFEEQADVVAELQKENQQLRETNPKTVPGNRADSTPEATILEATTAERDDLQKRFDAEQVKNHLLGVSIAKARDDAFFSSFKASIYAAAFEGNPDTPCSVSNLLKLRRHQINDLKQDSVDLAEANMQLSEEVKDTKTKVDEAENHTRSLANTLEKTETEMKFLRDMGNDYKKYVEGIHNMFIEKLTQGEVGEALIIYDGMVQKNNDSLTTMVKELNEEKEAVQKSLAASRSCCAHFTKMSSARADEVSKLEEKCRAQTKEMVAIDLENTALTRLLKDKDIELINFHEQMRSLTEAIDKEFASSQPAPVVARLNKNNAEITQLQQDLDKAHACIDDHEWNDQQREQDIGAEIEREVIHVEENRKLRIKLEKALAVYDKLEALIENDCPSSLPFPRRQLASFSPMEKEILALGESLTSDFNVNGYGDDLERMRHMYYQCVEDSKRNAAECDRIQNNYDKQMQLSEGLDWVAVQLFQRMLWLEANLRACGVSVEDFVYEEGQSERAELMAKCDQFLDLREVVAEGMASNPDAEEDREVEPEEMPQTVRHPETDDSQQPVGNDSEPSHHDEHQPLVESIPDNSEEWEDVNS